MKDRNVEFPDRYRLVKVAGTDDIYDLIPAPGEVVEEGTFINKATLLTDATAASLGGAKTVNEALNRLLELLHGGPALQIEMGNYFGESVDTKELIFNFEPKCLIIVISNGTSISDWNSRTGITLCVYIGQSDDYLTTDAKRSYNVIGNKITISGAKSTGNTQKYNAAMNSSYFYYYMAIG